MSGRGDNHVHLPVDAAIVAEIPAQRDDVVKTGIVRQYQQLILALSGGGSHIEAEGGIPAAVHTDPHAIQPCRTAPGHRAEGDVDPFPIPKGGQPQRVGVQPGALLFGVFLVPNMGQRDLLPPLRHGNCGRWIYSSAKPPSFADLNGFSH